MKRGMMPTRHILLLTSFVDRHRPTRLGSAERGQADGAAQSQSTRGLRLARVRRGRQTLEEALEKLRVAGLDSSVTAAQTHLNLGIVFVGGLKDPARGIAEFVWR